MNDSITTKAESSQHYFLLTLSTGNLSVEQIEEIKEQAINQFNCDGIEEFNLEEFTVDEILGDASYSGGDLPDDVVMGIEHQLTGEQQIKFYFSEGDFEQNAEEFFSYLNSTYSLEKSSLIIEKLEVQDWNEKWKESFAPIEISPHLSIIPSWEKPEDQNLQEHLYLYPAMAFGTGNHETTSLCLEIFDDLVENKIWPITHDKNKSEAVLDFGCGSGILGIAAAKKGVPLVDLYDIDQKALDNCQENVQLNFSQPIQLKSGLTIQPKVHFNYLLPHQRDQLGRASRYKLIFANILQHVLLEERDNLSNLLAPGGYLILSGLLTHQMEETITAYCQPIPGSEPLKLISEKKRNDWGALLLQKGLN